jgi:hypothetical protein
MLAEIMVRRGFSSLSAWMIPIRVDAANTDCG